jgi:hypothetical protein
LPGHPEAMKMEPPPTLFSHQCLEGVFCELRLALILGSPLPALCIAPVLYSGVSYVECRRFIASHT